MSPRSPVTVIPTLAWIALGVAASSVFGCDVYTDTLLGGGGAGAGGSGSGAGGEGGAPAACTEPSDCPGEDNECGTRTCDGGLCAVDAAAAGTVAEEQSAGNCLRAVCDGAGLIVGEPDDADVPDDNVECTTDSCVDGLPMIEPKAPGTSCGGSDVCNEEAECVECFDDTDCASMICTDTFTCAPPDCGDEFKNGEETDIDCGGPDCSGCDVGLDCIVPADCLSNSCMAGVCQATCDDSVQNQDESDVDCGGVCADCVFGQTCNAGTDCETGACNGGGTCGCAPNNGTLIISELRTRGPGMGNDEIVELFNPGTAPVTFSSGWTVQARSDMSASYAVRYTGAGQVIPPGGHLLLGGTAYAGPVTADGMLSSGITDDSSVIIRNGAATVDAICFGCGAVFGGTYECEGAPFEKTSCTANVAQSLERKPGGALGNCIDTQTTTADFIEAPSSPQNLMSPPTP